MKKIFSFLLIITIHSILSLSQPILICTKDYVTNGVLMSWTGDAPPYGVIRGISPNPFTGEYFTMADNINATLYLDDGALLSADNYYYYVSSNQTPVCSMISSIIWEDQKVNRGRINYILTITGVNLASSDTKIFLNKKEISPISSYPGQVTFMIPAGSLSGDFIVSSMFGATNPKSFKIESAWDFIQISQINYSSNFQWIDDLQGAALNTIFKVDNDGVKTKIGSLNKPSGLPVAQVGEIDYTWYGASLEDLANRGTIKRTSIDGGEITWGSIKPTGQTAYCAAVAADKTDTSFVYAADKYNGEIRKVFQDQFGGTLFASGLLMNNPAGMAVDNINPLPDSNSLWISLQSKISQYSSTGALIKQYSDTSKIGSYPAGMNFDDEGKLWIAKKSENRIERANLMCLVAACSIFRLTQPPTISSQCENINNSSNPYNTFIDPL